LIRREIEAVLDENSHQYLTLSIKRAEVQIRELTAPTDIVCVAPGAVDVAVAEGLNVPSARTLPIKPIDSTAKAFNNIIGML